MRTNLKLSLALAVVSLSTIWGATAEAAQTNLVVAGPPAVAVNVPFNVDVTLTNSFNQPITTATDRVYLTINGVGAGNMALRGGTVRFVGVRASRTPVTITASCPSRYLTKTITVAGAPVGTPPSITSPSFINFTEGTQGTFIVTSNGPPTPTVSAASPPGTPFLPAGVTFTNNGNGTATLGGSPAPGTAGTYVFTITASNGIAPNAAQTFTLTVQSDKPKVLLAHADEPDAVLTVQAYLVASGKFSQVDIHDSRSFGDGIPSVAMLQNYDVVLAWSNYSWANKTEMGNNLHTYLTGGGRVVTAQFSAFLSNDNDIQGAWTANNDNLIGYGSSANFGAASMIIDLPGHPLMTGVATFSTTSAYHQVNGAVNGGVVVAHWNDGSALVVAGVVGGRNRVDLNFLPPLNYWSTDTGDKAQIVVNALLYK